MAASFLAQIVLRVSSSRPRSCRWIFALRRLVRVAFRHHHDTRSPELSDLSTQPHHPFNRPTSNAARVISTAIKLLKRAP